MTNQKNIWEHQGLSRKKLIEAHFDHPSLAFEWEVDLEWAVKLELEVE